MRISLFGPPGAGKGSQAQLLVKRWDLQHISTGNLLRQAIQNDTPIGQEAARYVKTGQLVPDDLVRTLAEEAIAEAGYNNFVLDGYPRTVQQATWLTDFLRRHAQPLDAVIFFRIPDEVIIDRLSKRRVHKDTGENFHLDHKPPPPDVDPDQIVQRPDDRPEAIQRRLEVYREETQPVEAYYRERGQLVEVDAVGDFKEVHQRIVHVREPLPIPTRQKT